MSTKHLRRFLKEKQKEVTMEEGVEDSSDIGGESEPESGLANRFSFLEHFEEASGEDSGSDVEASKDKNGEVKIEKRRKKKTKKRKDAKDEWGNTQALEELDAEVPTVENDPFMFERTLFEVNSRHLNPDNELRKILGRRMGEASHVRHKRSVVDKIVKRKLIWPELKNVGLSMDLDRREGDVLWFKFIHSQAYSKTQTVFHSALATMDQTLLAQILVSHPYHLDSLQIMAEFYRNQEDYQASRDLTERGLFCCESMFAPRFQLFNFDHRLSYEDYENRAFYLLLHRHMRNLMERRCFFTALNFAKLIFRLDHAGDPLAILLTIDSIALKAKQYDYLILLHRSMKESHNLDRLPNFAYSLVLAHYMLSQENGSSDDELDEAKSCLATAIYHFPTVLVQILDKLNIQPDAPIEKNQHMNALAHERESAGVKLLTSCYVALCYEVWQEPSFLDWLAVTVRDIIADLQEHADEIKEWSLIRKSYFVGIPRNVQRHAYLFDVLKNSKWSLVDPAPPHRSRSPYSQETTPIPGSFLAGLVRSIFPGDLRESQDLPINAMLGRAVDAVRGALDINRGEQQERPQDEDSH